MKSLKILTTLLVPALLVMVCPGSVWADDEEVLDQEDIAKDLFFGDWQDFIKKGKAEFVLVPEYRFIKEGGESKQTRQLGIEIETYPGENWEIELEFELIKQIEEDGDGEGTREGLGNFELIIEYRYLHLFDPVVDLRVGFEFTQPLSNDGVTSGFRTYEPYLSARSKIGPVHVFGKLAWEFSDRDHGDEEDEGDVFEYHIAALYPHGKWRVGAELFGETNQLDGGDEHELYLAPEVRYRLNGDVEFGLAVPVGLTGHTEDWGILFSAYIGFDLKEGHAQTEKWNLFKRR